MPDERSPDSFGCKPLQRHVVNPANAAVSPNRADLRRAVLSLTGRLLSDFAGSDVTRDGLDEVATPVE